MTPEQIEELKRDINAARISRILTDEQTAYLLSLIERDRWIPVSQMPSVGQIVIAAYAKADSSLRIGAPTHVTAAYYEDVNWRDAQGGDLIQWVTHWRPLPPAPEENTPCQETH